MTTPPAASTARLFANGVYVAAIVSLALWTRQPAVLAALAALAANRGRVRRHWG